MDDFRFGELRERTLHRQLKAHYCPPDGLTEVTFGRAIADIWSPTGGIIEIQTANLGKLKTKLPAFLALGPVTVVHPLAVRKTLVTWNAEGTTVVGERRSPRKERIEAQFREIGALAGFLLEPGFCLRFCLVEEREHRRPDGQGSWRRKGVSRVDRELVRLEGEREFRTRDDWAALLPAGWTGPGTNRELAVLLNLTLLQTQSLTACFKRLGLLRLAGKAGRADLLERVS